MKTMKSLVALSFTLCLAGPVMADCVTGKPLEVYFTPGQQMTVTRWQFAPHRNGDGSFPRYRYDKDGTTRIADIRGSIAELPSFITATETESGFSFDGIPQSGNYSIGVSYATVDGEMVGTCHVHVNLIARP